MYYSEIMRIKRIENMLSKLAYFSVLLDMLVAVGSFLALHNLKYASTMLTVSDYAISAEIILACVLFALIVALKHFNNLFQALEINAFKSAQARKSGIARLKPSVH